MSIRHWKDPHRRRNRGQRLGLATLLFEAGDRHVSAEKLHEEANAAGITADQAVGELLKLVAVA